jgi:hypothetical protein
MSFACFVTGIPIDVYGRNSAGTVGADPAFEIMYSSKDKDARVQRLDLLHPDKFKDIKNTSHLHASSSDGCILFYGLDELLVSIYMPQGGSHDSDTAPLSGIIIIVSYI